MKSIMQDKDKRLCYLCALNGDSSQKARLDEHHIFGGPNRNLSEKYGLKVYLCEKHHIYGNEAVHRPDLNDNQELLHKIGQLAFVKELRRKEDLSRQQATERFVKIFGKNYVNEEELDD